MGITRKEIREFCENLVIENYTINRDLSVDVNEDVDLGFSGITEIPFKFGKVNGNFNVESCELVSLLNSPNEVKGYFKCSKNRLTSLEYLPKKIDKSIYLDSNHLTNLDGLNFDVINGDFDCDNNYLTSLKGCPKKVNGGFYCSDNRLDSLIGSPEFVKERFYCNNNSLSNLVGFPKVVKGDVNLDDNNIYDIKGISVVRYIDYSENPIYWLFNKTGGDIYKYGFRIDSDLVKWIKMIKLIKYDEINDEYELSLKRLKYLQTIFDFEYYIHKVEQYYKIVE